MLENIIIQVLQTMDRPSFISNGELLDKVLKNWQIKGLRPSSIGIGRIMAKLGHQSYHNRHIRGWIIN